MKTINSINHFKVLPAIFFFFIFSKFVFAQMVPINQSFSSDTVFKPFGSSDSIHGLKMSGSILLLSDTSLVRVVLIDDYGGHWLVYEAYPLIDTLYSFSFTEAGDETCVLNGIIPDSIRVDIINATVTIDSLNLNNEFIANAYELQRQAKWLNDSLKIKIMNRRIQEEHMYWRAGRTDFVNMFYIFKEQFFGKKYNISGIDFYKGGIFSKMNHNSYSPSNTDLVNEFDWRNRHCANDENSPYWDGETGDPEKRTGWITPVVNQYGCYSCWVFAPVAAVEAYINLYFNNHDIFGQYPHQLDIKLSELEVLRCLGPDPYNYGVPCKNIGVQSNSFSEMKNDGVHSEESSYNYDSVYGNQTSYNPPCSLCVNNPEHYIKIYNYDTLIINSEYYLKSNLIKRGPLSCLISRDAFFPHLPMEHYMLLVGYRIPKAGDTVYHGSGSGDPDIVLDEDCSFLSSNIWIFKNSWGANWGTGGFYITDGVLCTINDFLEVRFLYDTIQKDPIQTPILCSDEDGDGYYWWGVHRDQDGNQINPQSCNCPLGVLAEQEDCNDWDINAGPYDPDTYECTDISDNCITLSGFDEISGTVEWDTHDQHKNKNILIHNGGGY